MAINFSYFSAAVIFFFLVFICICFLSRASNICLVSSF